MTSTQVLVWVILTVAATLFFILKKCTPSEDEAPPTEPPSPLNEPDQQKQWIELLKLEYEKAADRYEHIYRAIWQNFSYMAVVAGGILSFGGEELKSPTRYFLALTPLFFWLVATFLPLNHYGEAIRERLRAIEDDVNRVYFPGKADPKLAHFKLFGVTHYKWRVRHAVALFGSVLTLFWLYFGVLTVSDVLAPPVRADGEAHTLQLKADPVRIDVRVPELASLRDSVSALSGTVRSLDSLVQVRLRPAQTPRQPTDTIPH